MIRSTRLWLTQVGQEPSAPLGHRQPVREERARLQEMPGERESGEDIVAAGRPGRACAQEIWQGEQPVLIWLARLGRYSAPGLRRHVDQTGTGAGGGAGGEVEPEPQLVQQRQFP